MVVVVEQRHRQWRGRRLMLFTLHAALTKTLAAWMSNRQILFHIGKSATMRIIINVERIETIAGDFFIY